MSTQGKPVERTRVKGLVESLLIMLDLGKIPYIIAGSYRRWKSLCGDIDVVLVIRDDNKGEVNRKMMQRFGCLATDPSRARTSIIDGEVAFQFSLTHIERLGSMLLHATGSQAFNERMRGIAKRQGFKLNQYGLYDLNDEEVMISEYEATFFEMLGIDFINPIDRG